MHKYVLLLLLVDRPSGHKTSPGKKSEKWNQSHQIFGRPFKLIWTVLRRPYGPGPTLTSFSTSRGTSLIWTSWGSPVPTGVVGLLFAILSATFYWRDFLYTYNFVTKQTAMNTLHKFINTVFAVSMRISQSTQ